jgi:hypothetical protein
LPAERTFLKGSVARIMTKSVAALVEVPCAALSTAEFGTSGIWCKDEA